ncbi:flagellin [Planctomycetota bacterium]
MGLRINTNISAISALRNLGIASRAQENSMRRLSTGLRITRASDDPSGLVISEQLRAQIGSLGQALENAETASNVIGTAEAALSEVSDLLVKIRESAIFALNDGGASTEQIQAEQDSVNAAVNAIDKISQNTRFGKMNLLDGSSAIQVNNQSAAIADLNIKNINFDGFASRDFTVDVTAIAEQASTDTGIASNAAITTAAGNVVFQISGNRGTQTITLGSAVNASALYNAINMVALNTGVYATNDGTVVLRSIDFGEDAFITLQQVGGSGAFTAGEVQNQQGVDIEGTINGLKATGMGSKLSVYKSDLAVSIGMEVSATGADYATQAYTFTAVKSGLNFQIGSEATPNDAVRVSFQNMNSGLLGSPETTVSLGGGNTLTMGGILSTIRQGGKNDLFADPGNAVRIVDDALDDVNGMRSFLGSLQSDTFESAIDSLGVAIENLSGAESQIRDLDFAAETAEFTRTQIMFQAGMAVMASANMTPQTVLTLLQ